MTILKNRIKLTNNKLRTQAQNASQEIIYNTYRHKPQVQHTKSKFNNYPTKNDKKDRGGGIPSPPKMQH